MLPYKVISANEHSVEDSKSHSLHVKIIVPHENRKLVWPSIKGVLAVYYWKYSLSKNLTNKYHIGNWRVRKLCASSQYAPQFR